MANLVGKKYVCSTCGSEFLVTKAGSGTLTCCNRPMDVKK